MIETWIQLAVPTGQTATTHIKRSSNLHKPYQFCQKIVIKHSARTMMEACLWKVYGRGVIISWQITLILEVGGSVQNITNIVTKSILVLDQYYTLVSYFLLKFILFLHFSFSALPERMLLWFAPKWYISALCLFRKNAHKFVLFVYYVDMSLRCLVDTNFAQILF